MQKVAPEGTPVGMGGGGVVYERNEPFGCCIIVRKSLYVNVPTHFEAFGSRWSRAGSRAVGQTTASPMKMRARN